ncbi:MULTISPECIES: MarC family protein [unclassified Kitasatospora]|uniref:MarC family protein n=1 Tax=unclassified Kitasatospora TaxID=2633591 RepID=UPI0007097327|nr:MULTISPECIES: MarC family protein [unclassified Kitasatospora]KQV05666.1 antibiotic resistance protein [Kitasatospora sp. Root107]KRB62470.1 antibiotic resistance protein [Kitasatospora sp. Root187]
MHDFDLPSTFVILFAVVGPPKVLLAFARLARTRTHKELVQLTLVATGLAAVVGVAVEYSAPFLTNFFHIDDWSLQLAGGVIFFIYAVALVLGLHLGGDEYADQLPNQLLEGLRELLLPYIASPLAMTALMVGSLERDDWGWRTTLAGAYLGVVAVNCICVLVLSRPLRHSHQTLLEVMSRLLGLLLAAVGVELFISGLAELSVQGLY